MILLYLLVIEVKGMSNIWKLTKLDFYIIKPYMKSIYLRMLIPIIFAAINRSLIAGISFAMFFVPTTITLYTFSIIEKNSMERLYSILPIQKSEEVIGRYTSSIIIGLISLIFSLISQSIILMILGEFVSVFEFILSTFIGIILFIFYLSFQLPGYYKFGFIKGKIFMYIPLVGFLITFFLIIKVSTNIINLFSVIDNSPTLFMSSFIIFTIITLIISVLISIKILKNKEI